MVGSTAALRQHYPDPAPRALRKQLGQLDSHSRRFVALSPFVVLASAGSDGRLDSSPRGGEPGFVHVHDGQTLWIPDASGNNRLDSLTNVAATGRVGALFLIPGVGETLRVNGTARIRDDQEALGSFATERRPPHVVLEITTEEVYLHCAKALMRAKLWDPESRRDRSVLPPTAQILNDQTGIARPIETPEEMAARYAPDL